MRPSATAWKNPCNPRSSSRTSTRVENEATWPGFHGTRCPGESRWPSKKVPLVDPWSTRNTPSASTSRTAWRLLTSLTSRRRSHPAEAPITIPPRTCVASPLPVGARVTTNHSPGSLTSAGQTDKGAPFGLTQGAAGGNTGAGGSDGATGAGGGAGAGTGRERPRTAKASATASAPSAPNPPSRASGERSVGDGTSPREGARGAGVALAEATGCTQEREAAPPACWLKATQLVEATTEPARRISTWICSSRSGGADGTSQNSRVSRTTPPEDRATLSTAEPADVRSRTSTLKPPVSSASRLMSSRRWASVVPVVLPSTTAWTRTPRCRASTMTCAAV